MLFCRQLLSHPPAFLENRTGNRRSQPSKKCQMSCLACERRRKRTSVSCPRRVVRPAESPPRPRPDPEPLAACISAARLPGSRSVRGRDLSPIDFAAPNMEDPSAVGVADELESASATAQHNSAAPARAATPAYLQYAPPINHRQERSAVQTRGANTDSSDVRTRND